ncbi:MAG TPA: hypothetical protein VMZ28_10625 [Kofleriaceae bacterium]|nr:hypothetical protein [Kofleriaceae bacterium]
MKAAIIALVLASSTLAHAGPWTRDQGHFYLNTSYSRISATSFYNPEFKRIPLSPYVQHVWGLYGEVGIVSRWLTATVDAVLFRHNGLVDKGATYGMGDWRVGLWTGLVTRPVRLSFGLTVGIPIGDAHPQAGPTADTDATHLANSLPTGDGEVDLEGRLALGYSFGGVRRWPVVHYLVVEAGYWLRTKRAEFSDAFVWKFELGTKFPWKFIERFWFTWRWNGVESFASSAQAAMNATGLGNGVTYIAPGASVYGRVWQGLGASIALDSAVRARSLPVAVQVMAAVSYQW